ncbi:ferredoxin reductase family protein [Plantactinospora soyae]|uniref:Ferric reductase n=1 Tax=Plantactinospora soyae TaxID=1544732 RepID=A0A927R377_9ACTN|nr:ferredoxin reductase family protein [Plantactinospora soyae]MBE1491548.1 putative ferric reductase [Plantactinospora soyae]
MNAPAAPPLRIPRVRPGTAGRLTLWLGVAANVVVVNTLLVLSPYPASSGPFVLGRFLGVHAAMVMALQLLLIARLPWFDRRIGMDRLTAWHRWTGFTLIWTVLAHATCMVIGLSMMSGLSITGQLDDLVTTWKGVLWAMIAAGLLVSIGIVSARFARRRLAYETWHLLHLGTYVAVLLALTHQIAVGTTFTASTFATAYWWTLWGLALGAVLAGRVLLPLWRNLRHRFRVTRVVPESDNVVSIHITGRHLDRLPAQAGQFFLWRFLSRDRWWQTNPFSLSTAPDGRSLRLTAKAVGTGSATLPRVRVGTRVFAEGPYGAFTALHRTRPATLLVAGGVGVTPIRSLLESLDGHIVVLYRVRSVTDAVLADELRTLADARGAELRLITGPSRPVPPTGPILGPDHLVELVPDIRERDVFVCGPPGMTAAVLHSLRQLRVPRRQVHSERFGLAG